MQLDGTDALLIRSCLNMTSCSTPASPDVITLVKRSTGPVDVDNLQGQFERNGLDKVILRPEGPDEQCGVQDPRITVDKKTGTYILAYTAYGDASDPPNICDHTTCGPSWQNCKNCCRTVSTKVAVSTTPEVASSWRRLNRTGDPGFDAKSTATLVRDTPPHYQFTGTGTVRSWESQDLVHWTAPEVTIAGRGPGFFDPGYCEAGVPPVMLSDGNYLFTYDTIINAGQHGKAGWAAGWAVLNGSNPREVVQRGGEPLVIPTAPWELQTPPEWNWTQAVREGNVPMIGTINALMPIEGAGPGSDAFIAWGCASDAVIVAFKVVVTQW